MSIDLIDEEMGIAMLIPDELLRPAKKPGVSKISLVDHFGINPTQTVITTYDTYLLYRRIIWNLRHSMDDIGKCSYKR
jgi:hypothetical protein